MICLYKKNVFSLSIFLPLVILVVVSCQVESSNSNEPKGVKQSNIKATTDITVLENAFSAKSGALYIDNSALVKSISLEPPFKVIPVRYEPQSSYLPNGFRCGLVFKSEGNEQALVTVGEGITEVLSCDGVIEIGQLKLNSYGNSSSHLGLIYGYRSPNTSFNGGLVVSYDADKQSWYVNEELSSDDIISEQASTFKKLQNMMGK